MSAANNDANIPQVPLTSNGYLESLNKYNSNRPIATSNTDFLSSNEQIKITKLADDVISRSNSDISSA